MFLKPITLFATLAASIIHHSYPTQLIAGISVPDTPTISRAIAYARANQDDQTYNHVMRSWLIGTASLSHLLSNTTASIDLEAYAVATILHDLGLDLANPDIVSPDKRFEVDGADAAVRFLREEGGKGWTEERLWEVWHAIAFHTTSSIAVHSTPFIWSTSVGIGTELLGPNVTVQIFGPGKVGLSSPFPNHSNSLTLARSQPRSRSGSKSTPRSREKASRHIL
jgi:hypothetical protein